MRDDIPIAPDDRDVDELMRELLGETPEQYAERLVADLMEDGKPKPTAEPPRQHRRNVPNYYGDFPVPDCGGEWMESGSGNYILKMEFSDPAIGTVFPSKQDAGMWSAVYDDDFIAEQQPSAYEAAEALVRLIDGDDKPAAQRRTPRPQKWTASKPKQGRRGYYRYAYTRDSGRFQKILSIRETVKKTGWCASIDGEVVLKDGRPRWFGTDAAAAAWLDDYVAI